MLFSVHTLINFLSDVAKLAVWLSRRNKIKGACSVDPNQMCKGLLAAHLRMEHTYKLDKLKCLNANGSFLVFFV